jgi:hypothetical protein
MPEAGFRRNSDGMPPTTHPKAVWVGRRPPLPPFAACLPGKRDRLRQRTWSPEKELGGQRGRPLPLGRLTGADDRRMSAPPSVLFRRSRAPAGGFDGPPSRERRRSCGGYRLRALCSCRQRLLHSRLIRAANLPPPSKSPVRGQRAMPGCHPPACGRRLNPGARPFRPSGSKAGASAQRGCGTRSMARSSSCNSALGDTYAKAQ